MKFSIRELLLVTVIVALGVAWCVDRARLEDKLHQQAETLNEQDVELAGLKVQMMNWPQVKIKIPPGMKLVPVSPNSSASAPNPRKP